MQLREHTAEPRLVAGRVVMPRSRGVAVRCEVAPFGHVSRRLVARRRESVAALVRRQGIDTRSLPTALRADGAYYARKDWPRLRCGAFREIVFESMPRGGGGGSGRSSGKAVASIVATLALTIAAWAVAGPIAGAIGLTAAIGAQAATAIVAATIVAAGSIAISYLTRPKEKRQEQDKPLSALALGGNQARLGQPLPIAYGQMRWAPDLAATDWRDFGAANNTTLGSTTTAAADSARKARTFKLLGITEGKFDLETIELGDTVLWTKAGGVDAKFADSVKVEIVEAGDPVTLFPVNVFNSGAVTGQELVYDTADPLFPPPDNWIGPFAANPSGTTATKIAWDIEVPAGFQVQNRSGKPVTAPVTVRAEYRPIDAAGAPTGSWALLSEKTYTGNGNVPAAFTEEVAVSSGRYEVRLRRNSTVTADFLPSAKWSGLRAFLTGANTFPIKTIAIQTTAGKQFANFQPTSIFVRGTRILPVWNGSAWVDTATRNPVWAFYDAATSTTYGGRWSGSRLDDLADLLTLADDCDTRGDTFDHVFQGETSPAEALSMIASSMRGYWTQAIDRLHLARDEARSIPAWLITDHEIVRGSMGSTYTLAHDDRPDGVTLDYLDAAANWRPAQVTYPTGATRPFKASAAGITSRAKAFAMAAYMATHALYCATEVKTFEVERDARFWMRGDMVAVSHVTFDEVVDQARVTAWDAGTRRLTFDHVPRWTVGTAHKVEIRSPTGRIIGPITITPSASNYGTLNAASLAAAESALAADGRPEDTIAEILARADGAELPSASITLTNVRRFLVAGTAPAGTDRVRVTVVPYAAEVYTAADSPGTTPLYPTVTVPTVVVPEIAGLAARYERAIAGSVMIASWRPTNGARRGYRVRMSYDSGVSYGAAIETVDPFVSVSLAYPQAVKVQVTGVMEDGAEGPPARVDLAEGDATIADGAVVVPSLGTDARDAAIDEMRRRMAALEEALNEQGAVVADLDADYQARNDGVTARFGELTASGFLKFRAAADQTGAYGRVEIGASAANGSSEAYGALTIEAANVLGVAVSRATIQADKFMVKVSGGTDLAPFEVATIGGSPAVRVTTQYVSGWIQSDNYAESGGIPTAGWRASADGVLRAKGAVIRDADLSIADVSALTVVNPVIRNGVVDAMRAARVNWVGTPTGYGTTLTLNGYLYMSPDAVLWDGYCYTTALTLNTASAVRDGTTIFGELAIRVQASDDEVVFRANGTAYVRRPAVGGGYTTYDIAGAPLVNPIALNPTLLGYALNDKWKVTTGGLIVTSVLTSYLDIPGGALLQVPTGANFLTAKLWAGGGAGGDTGFVGGPGEYRTAKIPTTPGEILRVLVGGPGRVSYGFGQATGFGGAVYAYAANYWRGGAGLTGIFRGVPGRSQSLLVAGGGGSAAKAAHGGAGGHATEAGQNGLTGNLNQMRGINGAETNGTVTQAGAGGGGGYEGGGNYGVSATAAAGRGGTGFSHASNTSASNTVGTRGTATAPNNGDADYIAGFGDGGAAQADGKAGLAVLQFTAS